MAALSSWALAMAIGGTVTGAVGQWRAGAAAKRAGEAGQESAESQAELSEYNARVAALQSEDAIARGVEEENRFRVGVRGLIGAQRAGFAAGNVDVGFGSALDVQADAAFLGELDALQIRTNAAREAWGFNVAAEDYTRRAEIARKEGVHIAEAGRVQRASHRIGAAGTLLSGTGSLLQAKYGFVKGVG